MEEARIDYSKYDVAVPWDSIPVTNTVPTGVYGLRVRELLTVGSATNKLMVSGHFIIIEGPLNGSMFPIQNYVIGTDDDKAGQDPQTWVVSRGSRELKQLLTACGVPFDPRSLQASLARAKEARFRACVLESTQKIGDYAGSPQNRISLYGPFNQTLAIPGRPSAAIAEGNGAAVTPKTRLRPTMTAESQPLQGDQAPSVDEDDDIPF